MKKIHLINIFLLVFIVGSCTIQKRKHLPGFYIKSHFNKSAITNQKSDLETEKNSHLTVLEIEHNKVETKEIHPAFEIQEDNLILEKEAIINNPSNSFIEKTIPEKKLKAPQKKIKENNKKLKEIKKVKPSNNDEKMAHIGYILVVISTFIPAVSLLTLPTGIILCAIALTRLPKDSVYRKQAKFGFILGMILIIILFLLLLLLSLL